MSEVPQSDRRRRHAYVQVVRGPSEGAIVRLDEPAFTIGRVNSNDLALEDDSVSRHHARLERLTDGNYRVVDLDSRNGTLVNGEEIESRVLVDGDRIIIGESIVVRFSIVGATEPEQAEAAPAVILATELDVLTGTLNRNAFLKRLAEATKARPLQLAVAQLEPDNFDALDRQVGQALLTEIAERLRPIVRACDLFGRTGPKQLGIFFPDLGLEAVQVVLERLRLQICSTPFHELNPTISLGATSLGMQPATPEELLLEAEMALAKARLMGGNRVQISWPETQDEKRHKVRQRCDLPLVLRLDGQEHPARLRDISAHGLGLTTEFSLPSGTSVQLEHESGGPLRVLVRRCVCRGPEEYLLGLAFDERPDVLKVSWVEPYLKSLGFGGGSVPVEERRCQVRLDLDLPATLSGVRAWLVNLSMGGAMLRCMTGAKTGDPVEVEVNFNQQHWQAPGRVVTATDKGAFWLLNVAFEPLDAAQERWIQGMLSGQKKILRKS